MKKSSARPNTSIRVDKEILHQARIAAITSRKTLGKWLEEAILGNIKKGGNKESEYE